MAYNLRTLMVLIGLCVATGNGFQYSDLLALNATCAPKDTCKSDKGPRMEDPLDWKTRNCFCDDLCADYGDCCLDAKAYQVAEQNTNVDNYQCIHLRQFGDIYMQGRCMVGWPDEEVARLCDLSAVSQVDPVAAMPVTSLSTARTYLNYYCAVCNNDSRKLEIWKPRLECPTLNEYQNQFRNLTHDYVLSKLSFQEESWGLYLPTDGTDVFHRCFVDPVLPDQVQHMVRKCKYMTSVCASNWTDTRVSDLCHSYTAAVYNFNEAFRNHHCAICNGLSADSLDCMNHEFTRFNFRDEFNAGAFALLFDFVDKSGSNIVGSTSTCQDSEMYDPFFRKCRNVVCGKQNHEYRFGKCMQVTASSVSTATTTVSSTSTTSKGHDFDNEIDFDNDTTALQDVTNTNETNATSNSNDDGSPTHQEGNITRNGNHPPQTLNCNRILLPAEEFSMYSNDTVYIEKYDRVYQIGEYERHDGGILVCTIQATTEKFSSVMGWITMACLGISCLCLMMHLTAFLMVPDLRNLSGKNLASLCLALLAAFTTFILSVFAEEGKMECFIVAASMYYFFLSSFCWMSVMAFDIWRTLRLATSELRVTNGSQWRKFIVYSVVGWMMPAAALSTVVSLDLVSPLGFPTQFLPALGERLCFFGHRKALLVFFAAPLATIMSLNIMFFIFSARIIAESTMSTAKMSSCHPQQNQFHLYMRLALLMGLTWISGIVAGYLQTEWIWYIFIALNTLQGLFIFLAFTCTRKVGRILLGNSCWRKLVLAQARATWTARTYSSSRQGLEPRDSNQSHLSQTSQSSMSHLTSNTSRTTIEA